MPYSESESILPEWAARGARAALVVGYLSIAVAGAIGTTWPAEYELAGWAFVVTRASGALSMVGALIAAYAVIFRRWLVEVQVIWAVGLGLTGYTGVILLYVGPRREWVLVIALMISIFAGIAGRGVRLLAKVTERLESSRAARH